MKLTVDRAKCIPIGLCTNEAPGHVEIGDAGELIVLKDVIVSESERREVESAVSACPTAALELVEDDA